MTIQLESLGSVYVSEKNKYLNLRYFNQKLHCSDSLTTSTNKLLLDNMASYILMIILGFGLFLCHMTYASPIHQMANGKIKSE